MSWLFSGAFESEGHLELMGAAWQWQLALVISLVALGLAWLGGPRRSRLLELVLLGAGGVAFAVAAAQPTWIVEGRRQEAARSAVLVDVSRSMSVLEQGEARSSGVADALRAIDPDEQTEVFLFGDSTRPGQPLEFTDASTDLSDALEAISDRFAGEDLASISVITDGIDRGWMRRRYSEEGVLNESDLP